jgi:transcriptional regulator with XRE-family HTH domain
VDIEHQLVEQMQELGRQIKQAREFRRLTLAALSRQADIGMQTLVRIEDGNSAVGMLNLHKVLRVLGLPQSLVPPNMPVAEDLPRHARHLDSEDTDEAIEAAANAACRVLDEWLAVKRPERDGISSNFQGQLREHVSAMLCGKPGAMHSMALKRLVYSDDFVGGPMRCEETDCLGWALRVRGEPTVVQDTALLTLSSESFDPYVSREGAVAALRQFVQRCGHPPGPVDAVPVFAAGENGYRF